MTALRVAAVVMAVVATGLADLRWLRVAQREHYLASSATRFALRWWGGFGPNMILGAAAVVGVVLSPLTPLSAMVAALAIAAGPLRFPLVGRSPGPVVWTPRLRAAAGVTAGLQAVVIAAAVLLGGGVPVSAMVALLSPLAVDLALALLRPIEDHKAGRFVAQASGRLAQIHPTVVAITGSYGKTTTKVYLAHLLQGSTSVVASPASFNNRAGLSRAVNEGLVPGTEVFIAEMGTYGPGEIADLVSWCAPLISAITAIGPVHLERFGTEERIVAAKSEIFGPAETAVLNVDDPRLAALADTLGASGKRVVRVSASDPGADVAACLVDGRLVVSRSGMTFADVPAPEAPPGNVAVALALAFATGAGESRLAERLADLPAVPNRRARTVLTTGATAIDDTFNSNPAGCRAALADLARLGSAGGKRVVVTPGMVELGPRQAEENRAFATEAAAAATHLVVVGATNRRALLAGATDGPATGRAEVVLADDHRQAVEWVKANTGPDDVVLYENQLPDHYP